MMNTSLYLSALINVFNVVPAFLLPVFSNGIQFFFQVLDNDTISYFEEADLSQFTQKTVYQILDHHLYKPGSPAVYGIDLPSGKHTYGNSRIIADVYLRNPLDFAEYPDFTQSMRDFLKEIGISEERQSGHDVPATLEDLCHEELNQDLALLKKQMEMKMSDIYWRFSKNLQGTTIASLSPATGVVPVNADFAEILGIEYQEFSSKLYKIILENLEPSYSVIVHTWDSTQAEIVENEVCAICKPNKTFINTRDIFAFRHFIKSTHTRYVAQYNKTTSEIPVRLQIKLLDVLFQYSPRNYARKMHRPSRKILWDDETAVQAYSSIYKYKYKNYSRLGLFKHYLVKLGLHIEPPELSVSDDDLNSEGNCLLELLSSIEETTNMEETHLFWFEVKTLSNKVYAMLAQDYKTGINHFRLKEDSISSEDLIDFIVALNHDVLGKKVVLMRLRSEKFPHLFDDKLSDWLSENEDKCVIHDAYHDIRGYYE